MVCRRRVWFRLLLQLPLLRLPLLRPLLLRLLSLLLPPLLRLPLVPRLLLLVAPSRSRVPASVVVSTLRC